MNKKTREIVYRKYDGHCGYCGCKLDTIKDMQVDHIEPKHRRPKLINKDGHIKVISIDKFNPNLDTIDNYMPACRNCNLRKGTMDIETFRKELLKLQERLKTQSGSRVNYKLALKYGLIEEKQNNIKFYFENYGKV